MNSLTHSIGLTSLANVGLVRIITNLGVFGYMYTILSMSICLLATLSFPIYSLYEKLKPSSISNIITGIKTAK